MTSAARTVIFRVLYILLVAGCGAGQYLMTRPPADGGPPGPGEGFALLLAVVFVTFGILPLSFVFWWQGFRNIRFRGLVLLTGTLILEWLTVFILLFAMGVPVRLR